MNVSRSRVFSGLIKYLEETNSASFDVSQSLGSYVLGIVIFETTPWGLINLSDSDLVKVINTPVREKHSMIILSFHDASSLASVTKWLINAHLSLAVIFHSHFSIFSSFMSHSSKSLPTPHFSGLRLPASIIWVESIVSFGYQKCNTWTYLWVHYSFIAQSAAEFPNVIDTHMSLNLSFLTCTIFSYFCHSRSIHPCVFFWKIIGTLGSYATISCFLRRPFGTPLHAIAAYHSLLSPSPSLSIICIVNCL